MTISVLSPEILAGLHERAPILDSTNQFFTLDLAELRAVGYLNAHSSLSRAVADQSQLAKFAPATALGIGMHHIWMGVARQMRAAGIDFPDIAADAAAGQIFAFGISEAGNDAVLMDSTTEARTLVDGSVALTGTKVFTSMSPAWTRLGTFGREGDQLVFGFLDRERDDSGNPAPRLGITSIPDWDSLGMRATQSYTTHLDGAIIAPHNVVARCALDEADPLRYAIFGVFSVLVASVYRGIAQRALELAVDSARNRTSSRAGGTHYSADPDIRHQIAEAALIVDGLTPQVESLARELDAEASRGEWGTLTFRTFAGVKHRAVEAARQVTDIALRVSGGAGYRRGSEISRLHRDALAGIYHPSDPQSVRRIVAADLLD